MARKRTPPASPKAPPKEDGARELHVESGPPPQLDREPDDDQARDYVVDDRPPLEAIVETLEAWEVETVGLLLSGVLLVFHWTLGRAGPPDAYVPDDAELSAMARPATRMLNKSERARRLATHGDGLAFGAAFGGFVVKETREVAAYAAASEQAPPPDLPLADVGGVHVAEGNGEPVRRWRPRTEQFPE